MAGGDPSNMAEGGLGSISSIASSMDEDTERLLSEYQIARNRAEMEIQRARQTLQLPHRSIHRYIKHFIL